MIRLPDTLQAGFAIASLALAIGWSLVDRPVIAGDCDYHYGGCSGVAADTIIVTTPSAAACAAICGGRTACTVPNPMKPYGCSYTY